MFGRCQVPLHTWLRLRLNFSAAAETRGQHIRAVGAADDQTYLPRKNNESRQLRANRYEKGTSEGAKRRCQKLNEYKPGPAWRHSAHHAAGTRLEVAGLETPVALTWNAAK